jgi:RNA polymerase sigma-70 factor, ECF subfamily
VTTSTLPVQRPGTKDDMAVSLDAWVVVQRVQAGDTEAFGLLYQRYHHVVFRYLCSRLHGDTPLAEDLCSETFLRGLKRIGSFTWQGRDFGAWLITIARNLVADHYKCSRTKLEVTTADMLDADREDQDPWCSPESAVLGYLTNLDLLTALNQLSKDQRDCVVFRFMRGFTTAETAVAMDRDYTAIKSLQWRATRSLALLLAEEPTLAGAS